MLQNSMLLEPVQPRLLFFGQPFLDFRRKSLPKETSGALASHSDELLFQPFAFCAPHTCDSTDPLRVCQRSSCKVLVL